MLRSAIRAGQESADRLSRLRGGLVVDQVPHALDHHQRRVRKALLEVVLGSDGRDVVLGGCDQQRRLRNRRSRLGDIVRDAGLEGLQQAVPVGEATEVPVMLLVNPAPQGLVLGLCHGDRHDPGDQAPAQRPEPEPLWQFRPDPVVEDSETSQQATWTLKGRRSDRVHEDHARRAQARCRCR